MAPSLLGPPELHNPKLLAKPRRTEVPPAVNDPFMDLMVANFNQVTVSPSLPPMGYTEDSSATYLSSGNPCLDFFFHVVPNTPPESIRQSLQAAWDHILQVAVNGKLKEDQMIKRVFVFSDMEFDQASSRPWETDYQAIVRKFTEKGYGNLIPEIVFWNLRDSRATPVPATQKGVALVSGFSKNLMKLFLDGDGVIDPVSIMEAAISGEEYQKLAVLD